MQNALQTHIQTVKAWLANWVAESKPLQELEYLGEKLWQLK